MPDIKGIDLASWQGAPGEWKNDQASHGIYWAGVKFTEVSPGGVYQNPDAKADWDFLYEHDLGRIAYLFAHPAAGVAATVAAFRTMTSALGLLPADGVAVDLEVSDGMSPAAVASWAREVLAELEAVYGRRIILYANDGFIEGGFCEGLENYLLWVAAVTTPGLPYVPPPFADWFAHQFSLAPPVDQDVAHFSTLSAMRAAMGSPQFQTIVAVHVTTGEESLISLSHLLQTEISTLLRLTVNGSADSQFTPALADYLDTGNLQAPMPKGVAVRFYERVKV
jgi:Glycosyl hydrolases family 25